MNRLIPFPPEASVEAVRVDRLYFALLGTSAVVFLAVLGAIVIFAVRYRAGTLRQRAKLPTFFSRELEVGWTATTLLGFLGLFAWAAAAGVVDFQAPPNALELRVLAKQWMWKFEHPGGAREIDVLHLPVGVPVRLSMTSQDVIHSFYVPAFRQKQDVLPDRVTTLWFTPSLIGRYPFRCAEYCGTAHSHMTGEVIVMTAADYAAWAAGNADTPLVSDGERYFREFACAACHRSGGRHAPDLAGLFGRRVELADGRFVVVDGSYLERAILDPRHDVAKGYEPTMPSYRGVLSSRQTSALIAYLKSMPAAKGEP